MSCKANNSFPPTGLVVVIWNYVHRAKLALDRGEHTYDPYGTTTASTPSTGGAPNPFGFDGGFYASCVNGGTTSTANCPSAVPSSAPTSSTSQNGLILFGTRYYNPATATWTQPDPAAGSLATDPTQAAAYSFAGDDPINSTDSSGLVSIGDYCTSTKKAARRASRHLKKNPTGVIQNPIDTKSIGDTLSAAGNTVSNTVSNVASTVASAVTSSTAGRIYVTALNLAYDGLEAYAGVDVCLESAGLTCGFVFVESAAVDKLAQDTAFKDSYLGG